MIKSQNLTDRSIVITGVDIGISQVTPVCSAKDLDVVNVWLLNKSLQRHSPCRR